MSKALILYYSQAVGNTESVANKIAEKLGADMEKIDMLKPYRSTYEEISAQGREEVNKEYKPSLKPINLDITNYGTLVIATPTWWYTMAPSIRVLLFKLDLANKRIILVQTHAVWPGHCLEDMKELCEGGNVIATFAARFDASGGNEQITSDKELESWVLSMD